MTHPSCDMMPPWRPSFEHPDGVSPSETILEAQAHRVIIRTGSVSGTLPYRPKRPSRRRDGRQGKQYDPMRGVLEGEKRNTPPLLDHFAAHMVGDVFDNGSR